MYRQLRCKQEDCKLNVAFKFQHLKILNLTATAAASTARTQACASGDELNCESFTCPCKDCIASKNTWSPLKGWVKLIRMQRLRNRRFQPFMGIKAGTMRDCTRNKTVKIFLDGDASSSMMLEKCDASFIRG